MTCLGLPVDGTLSTGAVPVDVFVIVRSVHEGDFTYDLMSTEALDTICCLGMIGYAKLVLEAGILRHSENPEEGEE